MIIDEERRRERHGNTNSCIPVWIETLLQIPLPKFRKYCVWRILAPYLINVKHVKVTIRGEYTKTRQDRYVYLTSEMVQELSLWLDYKYRHHRSCYADKDGNYKSEHVTPVRKPDGLVFAIYNKSANSDLHTIYVNMAQSYANTLDRIGKGDREDNNNKCRKITFHSFRRFIKSTISDLGYSDYSEWFIGYSGSTYYRKREREGRYI
jgi:hypothetical protein